MRIYLYDSDLSITRTSRVRSIKVNYKASNTFMTRAKRRCGILSRKKWLHDIVIYSGAVRRKRVSKQVTPVDARTITGLSDIKYGPRGGSPAKSHLRVASSPGTSAGSVGKAGITRAKRTCRASRLIVWKMAYCLHLPTTCTLWPYSTTLYIHPPFFAILKIPLSLLR